MQSKWHHHWCKVSNGKYKCSFEIIWIKVIGFEISKQWDHNGIEHHDIIGLMNAFIRFFSLFTLALICSQCWCKLMLITQAVYNLRWNCSIGFIAENKKPIAFETLSYSNILAWMNKLNARASSFIGKCKFSAVFFLSNENP